MAQNISEKENIVISALTFLAFCSFLYMPSVASAAEGSFSVGPLFSEIEINAESEKRFSLEVSNDTIDPVVFRLSFIDFGSLDESGGIAFLGKGTDFQQRYGLASWMSAEKDVVTVFPQGKEVLNLTINNRESLSAGGHYGAVLFRIEKEGGEITDENSNVSISKTLTALVFVRKIGGEITDFNFVESTTRKDMLGIPDKLSLRFRNSGNTHVTPRGRTEVRDMFGRVVRKGILNEESSRVLPESYRVYPTAFLTLSKAFLPGYYTVAAQYRYDGQDEFTSFSEQKFFAWGLSILWGAGVLMLCGFFFRILILMNDSIKPNP